MYFYNQFLFFSCFYNNFNDDLLSFASLLLTHSLRSLSRSLYRFAVLFLSMNSTLHLQSPTIYVVFIYLCSQRSR